MGDRREQVVEAYERLGGNLSAVAREIGLDRSTVRHHIRRAGIGTKPLAGGRVKPIEAERREPPTRGVKRYILTSAQNNTKVNDRVWSNLLALGKHYRAEILVGTYSYNTNAYGKLATKRGHAPTGSKELWFDERLTPYIGAGDDRNIELAHGLVWCGRANILPTASRPLSGFETYTGRRSGIFPHAKLAMSSVASGKHEATKFNYTTGTVTQRNYIAKAAGMKAEHHHCYGALLVEVDRTGAWWVRQLNADGRGRIYDLDLLAEDGAVTSGHAVEAIVWGDIHEVSLEKSMRDLSWAEGGILDTLRPKFQFMHDLVDFHARNHHDIGNPHKMFERHVQGLDNVETELQSVADFLHLAAREWCKTVVVDSNHDNFFLKWLREADYRRDPTNAEYFLEAQREAYGAIRRGDSHFHAIEWALRRAKCPSGVKFLEEDESFVICRDKHGGVECGMHGHLGVHGARGSPIGLSKMGRKANTSHTHWAAIIDGMYVAGLWGRMDQSYNKGPGAWSHSLILTYKNGKRAIVTVWDTKWRA